MRKLRSMSFFCVLFIVASGIYNNASYAQAPQEEREIISEGVGRTTAEAAQNAAQNALTNIVGSFMDSNKVLEKRVEIKEGIRSETKSINTDIKEYSQGSIRKFEILDVTGSQGELVRVQARVVVRVEDFRAYIKKLAETEVKVDEGLFAQMKTEQKQNENLGCLLYDRVFLPIVEGEVVRFKAGAPKPLLQYNLSNDHRNLRMEFFDKFGQGKIVALEVAVSLDKDFIENLNNILRSAAKNKYQILPRDTFSLHSEMQSLMHAPGSNYQADILIALNNYDTANSSPSVFDAYFFSGVRKELSERSPWTKAFTTGSGSGVLNGKPYSFHRDYPTPAKTLLVEFLDGTGNVLQRDQQSGESSDGLARTGGRLFVVDAESHARVGQYSKPWSMLGTIGSGSHAFPVIRTTNKMVFFVALEDETLEKAKSISIKLAN